VTFAVVNVVLGVAVYLRWAVQVFTPRADGDPVVEAPRTPLTGRLALSLAAAGCIALSVLPEGLIGLLAGAPLH